MPKRDGGNPICDAPTSRPPQLGFQRPPMLQGLDETDGRSRAGIVGTNEGRNEGMKE